VKRIKVTSVCAHVHIGMRSITNTGKQQIERHPSLKQCSLKRSRLPVLHHHLVFSLHAGPVVGLLQRLLFTLEFRHARVSGHRQRAAQAVGAVVEAGRDSIEKALD
jgi:hypothetical protein